MTALLKHNCPRCSTVGAAFPIAFERLVGIRDHPTLGTCRLFDGSGICPICGRTTIFEIFLKGQGEPKNYGGDLGSLPTQIAIGDIIPSVPTTDAPEYIPQNCKRFYDQAFAALRRKDFDAAGAMFRKSLDSGLKELIPHLASRDVTLAKRVKSLGADQGVTPAMISWADEIKELGNDAAHEDDPFDAAGAHAIHQFTRSFLEYTFTMPARIQQRRKAPSVFD